MEQLSLLDFNDIRRPNKGKELSFTSVSKGFQLQYEHPNGKLYQGNSIDWLASLDDASVDLVFADPPYNVKNCLLYTSPSPRDRTRSRMPSSA